MFVFLRKIRKIEGGGAETMSDSEGGGEIECVNRGALLTLKAELYALIIF